MSKNDIINEMKKGKLNILPFDDKNLKGASYDITPTMIALSTRYGMLEPVYCDNKYPFDYYFYIRPKDTVLIVSKEYISVPEYMAGYVISRVSNVVKGIGHVCTSIDPNWKGAILIALNNPTNKLIKIYAGSSSEVKNIKRLATVTFHYLDNPIDANVEYTGMRRDLLDEIKYSNRNGIKAFFQKKFHPYRVEFTDFFFNYCDQFSSEESKWEEFVKPLTEVAEPQQCSQCQYCRSIKKANKKKEKISDFVIRESKLHKLWSFWILHKHTIYNWILFILVVLAATNNLPDVIKKIVEFYTK